MRFGSRLLALVLLAATALSVAGCQWRGVNSLPLPGTEGRGDGAYAVHIQLPDVATIDRNSRVRIGDVTVGRVSDLALQGEHALVTVMVNGDVELPANAVAKIGQTSLLGSPHVELSAPVSEPAHGRLEAGATIPLAHAGAYPTTEQTLSSLAVVLGGGGLDRIREINVELNSALSGREDAVRDLLAHLDELLTSMDGHRAEITRAIDGLDRLAVEVAAESDVLAESITVLRPALGVLAEQRHELTSALESLGQLGDAATRVIDSTQADLVANLRDLAPVLAALANSGPSLTDSTGYMFTFPFPLDTYANAVRGDYANGEVTLDLRLPTLDDALLLGTPLHGSLGGNP